MMPKFAVGELNRDLIDTAVGFVGIHETTRNRGPMVDVFESIISRPHGQPWCCDFVQYCVRSVDKLRGSRTVLYATESVTLLWLHTPKVQRIQEPEPGAIVCWGHYDVLGLPSSTGHVGIVKEVLPGGMILTVEGNTPPDGNDITRDANGLIPDGVYIKQHPAHIDAGPMRTLGYLRAWS